MINDASNDPAMCWRLKFCQLTRWHQNDIALPDDFFGQPPRWYHDRHKPCSDMEKIPPYKSVLEIVLERPGLGSQTAGFKLFVEAGSDCGSCNPQQKNNLEENLKKILHMRCSMSALPVLTTSWFQLFWDSRLRVMRIKSILTFVMEMKLTLVKTLWRW